MNPSESESSPHEPSGLQVEVGAKPRFRVRAVWSVLAFVFLALVTGATLIGWSPNSLPAPAPAITWSPSTIEVILSSFETTSRGFTVSSSTDLTNVIIEAVPTIAPFLTINPSTVSRLRSNKPQTVQVSFAIPATATLGTYIGTIHLRVGGQTLPQTLKVTVNVRQFDAPFDVQKGQLANDIRSEDLASAYRRVGAELASRRVFNGLDQTTLNRFADTLDRCVVTESGPSYQICSDTVTTPTGSEEVNFTFFKDGLAAWRLLSW